MMVLCKRVDCYAYIDMDTPSAVGKAARPLDCSALGAVSALGGVFLISR